MDYVRNALDACRYHPVPVKLWPDSTSLPVAGSDSWLVALPVGIFWNKGWEVGNHPLEPWAATLIIELFAAVALLLAAYMRLTSWYQAKSPQRVAITDSHLILPHGPFSKRERALPLAEIRTSLFNVGFVRQLQVKHGRRKILLVSALFPTDEDFDEFVRHFQS